MKVYLEEKDMPKDYKTTCKNCPFSGDEGLGCEEIRMLDKDFICPIKSLSDYTKQVRKEVCEKFVDKFMLEYTMGNEPVEDIIYKVADQMQGEDINA